MTIFADTLTGGIIAGTIVAAIVALIALLAIVVGVILWRNEGPFPLLCGVGLLLATIGVYVWASWPLAYEYHHWVDKTGTVAEISKRLVPTDDGMQEKIVVRFADAGGVYGVTETRATLLKSGMRLHIRCKKAYEFGVNRGAHGWDCKYVSSDLDGAAA